MSFLFLEGEAACCRRIVVGGIEDGVRCEKSSRLSSSNTSNPSVSPENMVANEGLLNVCRGKWIRVVLSKKQK